MLLMHCSSKFSGVDRTASGQKVVIQDTTSCRRTGDSEQWKHFLGFRPLTINAIKDVSKLWNMGQFPVLRPARSRPRGANEGPQDKCALEICLKADSPWEPASIQVDELLLRGHDIIMRKSSIHLK